MVGGPVNVSAAMAGMILLTAAALGTLPSAASGSSVTDVKSSSTGTVVELSGPAAHPAAHQSD
jgi:hypothetical protein